MVIAEGTQSTSSSYNHTRVPPPHTHNTFPSTVLQQIEVILVNHLLRAVGEPASPVSPAAPEGHYLGLLKLRAQTATWW